MIQFEIPLIGVVGLVAMMGLLIIVLGVALARARFAPSPTDNKGMVALGKSASDVEAGSTGLLPAAGPPTPVQPQSQNSGILEYFKKAPSAVDSVTPKDENYLGKISFRLSYSKERHTFSVHILEAADLPAMDIGGSSDPYVRVSLLPSWSVKWSNLSYLQSCHIGHTQKTISATTLCVQVMDHDRFSRDDPMGEILLPMENVRLANEPVYWKQLQKPTGHKEYIGEILVSLCYLSQFNKLNVVVNKAKNLTAKDVIGTSDPYVKLWWVQNGIKMEKHKTTVKSQTLNPLYNEAFTFTLPPKETLDHDAQLVMDHDLLSSNDEIGHAVIGSKTGTDSGCTEPTGSTNIALASFITKMVISKIEIRFSLNLYSGFKQI